VITALDHASIAPTRYSVLEIRRIDAYFNRELERRAAAA